jgi:hypothetical protein
MREVYYDFRTLFDNKPESVVMFRLHQPASDVAAQFGRTRRLKALTPIWTRASRAIRSLARFPLAATHWVRAFAV